MREQIVAVLCKPYLDKYAIEVYRQTDRFHVPTIRVYQCRYTDERKVFQLCSHFIDLNTGIQLRTIKERILKWRTE